MENQCEELPKIVAQKLLIKNGLLWPLTPLHRGRPWLGHYYSDPINKNLNSHIYINNKKLICERNRLIEIWSLKKDNPELLKIMDVGLQSLTLDQYMNYACCNNILAVQKNNFIDFWDICTAKKIITWKNSDKLLYDFIDNYLIFMATPTKKTKKTNMIYYIYPIAQ